MNRAAAGGLGEAEEQRLLDGLADVSVEVANRYDHWVRSSSSEAKASAMGLADALLPVLEKLYRTHQSRLDKMQSDIVAADGNPEVLYEQKGWQLDRGFSLAALGQLCWLEYRAAMLHPEPSEARTARLKKAVEGFSEFVYAQDAKLAGESLLGRALAERELKEFAAAIGDLKAVIDRGKDSPLYWPARLTLAEVKVASGDTADSLAETQRLLGDAGAASLPSEVMNQARLLRFQALAATSKKGLTESARHEAAALARQLSELGAVWSKRVHEIALANLDDPRILLGPTASAEWIAAENLASAERFKEASAAYEAILQSTDPAARAHATEAHHRLGVCYFRLGRYVDSERQLRAFLNAAPEAALAGEAAYLRFRSAEGTYREHPSTDTRELFRSAVEAYVKQYPRHESFYEGIFRWGEILQSERRWLEAADALAKVKGPPTFEIHAAAGEVQSLAELLSNPPEKATSAWADPLKARGLKAFERFGDLVAKHDKGGALAELRARTLLSKAMIESAAPAPRFAEVLGTLRDFETRFPGTKDLHLLAAALRVSAESALGRAEDAERGLERLLAADPRGDSADLLERVGRAFLRISAETAGRDQRASDRWAALAAKVYDRLHAEGRAVPSEIKQTLAVIYMQQGRLDEAAALYRDLVQAEPQSTSVLRNAAMIADRRAAHAEAADLWARLAKLQKTATPAWYDVRLQAARDLLAAGEREKSCASLREVDDFHPDLRDAASKKRFEELESKVCSSPKS